VQGLLAGARLSLQAQPSGRAADNEDIGERPAIDLVAWGTIIERSNPDGEGVYLKPYRVAGSGVNEAQT
jgi:hypothetical protein